MESWLTRITDYLLTQSWQIAVLTIVVAAASFFLRNRSAHVRYLLWLVVLAKCLVPPLHTVPLAILPQEKPPALLPVLPAADALVAEHGPPEAAVTESARPISVQAETVPSPRVMARPAQYGIRVWLAVGWIVGAVVLSFYYLLNAVRTQIWLQRGRKTLPGESARSIESFFTAHGVSRMPHIWLLERISQPFVWGLVRGSIYLPAKLLDGRHAKFQASLFGHELSHIMRFDAAVNSLQVIAQTVFWFHPLVWWANRKIRVEREKCCDEMTIARLNASPEEYGEAIVETLAAKYEQARPVPSLAVAGQIKNIEERINTMLKPGKKFYKYPTLAAATVAVLMALLTVPTALVLTARAGTKTEAKLDEKPTQSLVEAALNGDIHRVRLHLSAGAAIDAKDKNKRDRTALHHAARHGYMEIARLLIAQGADVNAKDSTGDTPLHTAIQKNQVEIANLLVLKGADVNAKCEYGSTPVSRALMGEGGGRAMVEFLISKGARVPALHLAAYRGDIDKVRRSLAEGTNVDVRDEAGHTPLSYAASAGQMHVVEFLVSKGPEVDAKDHRHRITPLCYAANAGWRNVTELLVSKGADVNAKVRWGQTLLCYPVRGGHKEVVELLIDKGADVNPKRLSYPPLYWAIWSDEDRGSWDMTELLVRKGADVSFVAEDDWPYLHYIAETNDWEVAELLLAHGAKLNAKDGSGRTALHIALSRGRRNMAEFLVSKGAPGPELHLAACLGNLERVKSLVEGGVDVDTTDERGFTALYWATSIGREEVAEFLVDKGADIGVAISSNRALSHRAAQWGSAKLVKLLIDKGVDVDARAWADLTPLHSAAERGHKDIVEMLIAARADVKAKEADANTPLHNAARAGRADVVQVLLAHRADASAENKWGETPLQLAKKKGHTEIVELLRKHGAKE